MVMWYNEFQTVQAESVVDKMENNADSRNSYDGIAEEDMPLYSCMLSVIHALNAWMPEDASGDIECESLPHDGTRAIMVTIHVHDRQNIDHAIPIGFFDKEIHGDVDGVPANPSPVMATGILNRALESIR